ncbi:hypothetical protein DAPPUDRAFT_332993 [Daphnia pulex]|uniref:Uncharacterized protein n=1 Tax=Daphnia pulex TaxID=6669 RepID=E9HRJ0_DAPPU|nr:hypothetical protein DAPPUDRAFT_332993 [Daphnia pulex]|eukprot:EFX65619.1 hypothetical protein DAPPUDRAFT_332993 [Daphnia pulex]
MESRDEEVQPQLLSDIQVVENGLYEIAYINISEEDMVSELELMESVKSQQ